MDIKKTILIVILFIFEGLTSVALTCYALDEYAEGVLGSGLASVVAFYGFALISLAELIRLMLGKKNIILPMLGMKLIAFTLGITVGLFADYLQTADGNALGAGITFGVLTITLIICGLGTKFKFKREPKNKGNNEISELEMMRFNRFAAEWYWDEVSSEYCRLKLKCEADNQEREREIDELLAAANDQIYIYACNKIAFLFEWLLKRDALSNELTSVWNIDLKAELEALKREQGNPSEFIYNYMDGKFIAADIEEKHLMFLHSYYERMGYKGIVREVCYEKDYEEIVLEPLKAEKIEYCFDFSWEAYRAFEKVLDARYEKYCRDTSGENFIKLEKTVYSTTLKQELEVFVEQVSETEKEDFEVYINKCLSHVADFPVKMLEAICTMLKTEWGVDWVGDIESNGFMQSIGAGDISIYKPFGEEIAYVLGFEADFEEEHGISICIRGNEILSVDYRMDACSPWNTNM